MSKRRNKCCCEKCCCEPCCCEPCCCEPCCSNNGYGGDACCGGGLFGGLNPCIAPIIFLLIACGTGILRNNRSFLIILLFLLCGGCFGNLFGSNNAGDGCCDCCC